MNKVFFVLIFISTLLNSINVDAQNTSSSEPVQQLINNANATATLTGKVYLDANANGTQDNGEPGLANMTVIVIDSNDDGTTITTDNTGSWSLNVIPGGTQVFIVRSGYVVKDTSFNGLFDGLLIQDAEQTEGDDPTFIDVQDNQSNDAGKDGYAFVANLSGRLYFDTDKSSTQDPGEPGIANVDVKIDDAFGTSQMTETDANGDWNIQVPIGDIKSTIDVNDPDFPTDAEQTEGENPTPINDVMNGDTINETDGFFGLGKLSGRVYYDVNGNGTQDTGESGIKNVDVQIEDVLGSSKTIETDANGDWSVEEVPVGSVTSTIDTNDTDFPTGALQTEGTNPTTTAIKNDETSIETDGFFESGQLSGRLYYDKNGNGSQDAGESGIPNVDVQIDNALGNSQTIETDADGDWNILVPAGDVTSTIDTSDPDFPTGATKTEGTNPTTTTIANGDAFDEIDGFFESGQLSGRLYFDVNGNGTQDNDESGIANVDVQIDGALGNSQTIETDADGNWNIQVPVGDVTSTIDTSDPDFPTGATQAEGTNPTTTTITNSDTFDEVDGFFESGQLSGKLYFDVNGNGTQDAGESGIANVDVQIDDALGNSQTIETDADGNWNIQVPVGDVTSTIDTSDPDFPTGAIQAEGTNPTTTAITNGDTFNEVDGFFESGQLSGRLYSDINGNGTQDTGESGISNVDVQIDNALGNSQTIETDVNGDWNIQVPVGEVTSTIDVNDPDFPTVATQTEGTNPTPTTVTNGGTFDEIDDGFFESGQLSGRLYLDANGNSTQDNDESGIPSVDVQVDDALGNSQTVETDANGDWNIQVPVGVVTSTIDEDDTDFPADAIQTEGNNPTTIDITNGDTINEKDGFYIPDPNDKGTLTGHLYFDENGDGKQNAGEADLPNINVQIDDALGNSQTTETDANGDWSEEVSVGYAESTVVTDDSDFPTGAEQTEGDNPSRTLVIPNTTTFSENDGFFVTGTLTGHLYLDENGDEEQNPGEADLPNIDIKITDSQNNTETVSTDANGDWSITIPTGEAISDIDETTLPDGAEQTQGTDPTTTNIINGGIFSEEPDGFFVSDGNEMATLAGTLYLDENGNGTQDLNEPGIESISVEIEDEEGNIETVETDFNGNWSIEMKPGETISLIDETDQDFPENSQHTQGTNPTLSQVVIGEITNEIDGYYVPQEVEVFNAISPNGDGQNDFLKIEGLSPFTSNSIKIFNRSGVKVYDVKNYGKNGDVFKGVSNGRITIRKGEKLPSGTYFYIIRYEDDSGNKFKKQGYLYIN